MEQNEVLLIVVSLATILFTILGSVSLYRQILKIWKPPRGVQSISTINNFVSIFSHGSFLTYGYHHSSKLIVFNSVARLIFYLPIVIGLVRFAKLTRFDLFLICFLPVLLLVSCLPSAVNSMFVLASFLGTAGYLHQPYEIWRNKTRGRVETSVHAVFLISASFWLIYSILIHDYRFVILQSVFVLAIFITLIMCLVYKPKPTP